MAGLPERGPAAPPGRRLLGALARRWDVAADSWCTVCEVSGATGTGAASEGLHPRQSEGDGCRKRGRPSDLSGFDAGTRVNGKKRHVFVDTVGLGRHAIVHAATSQARDGGSLLLSTLGERFPGVAKLCAAGASQGPVVCTAVANVLPRLTREIVTRSDQGTGGVGLPNRWSVERTLAWLKRWRRLAKDFENRTRHALAFLHLASIRLMLRKLCTPS